MAATTTKRRVRPVGWCSVSQGYRRQLGVGPVNIYEKMRHGGSVVRLTKFISSVDIDVNDDPEVALKVYAMYLDSLGVLLRDTCGLVLGQVTINNEKFIFDLGRRAGYAEMRYGGGRIHIKLVRVGNADGYKVNRYLRYLHNLLGQG